MTILAGGVDLETIRLRDTYWWKKRYLDWAFGA